MAYRQGAVGALLDIYQQVIADLVELIKTIPDDLLAIILDEQTSDENCRSIQTILTHVVHSGYGYATSIYNSRGHDAKRPDKISRSIVKEYIDDLEYMFLYTEGILKEIKDDELEQVDDSLKMKTAWGQLYDIEQLMEHAIVHILRHKRQIEKFKYNQIANLRMR